LGIVQNACITLMKGFDRLQMTTTVYRMVHEIGTSQKCFFFPGQIGARRIGSERMSGFSAITVAFNSGTTGASTAGPSGAETSLFTTGASFGGTTTTTSADSSDSESRPLLAGS